MTHKKIIKRENGDTVQIQVRFYEILYTGGYQGNKFRYDASVYIRSKGRIWQLHDTAATPEEIHTAKLELWELLKPIK